MINESRLTPRSQPHSFPFIHSRHDIPVRSQGCPVLPQGWPRLAEEEGRQDGEGDAREAQGRQRGITQLLLRARRGKRPIPAPMLLAPRQRRGRGVGPLPRHHDGRRRQGRRQRRSHPHHAAEHAAERLGRDGRRRQKRIPQPLSLRQRRVADVGLRVRRREHEHGRRDAGVAHDALPRARVCAGSVPPRGLRQLAPVRSCPPARTGFVFSTSTLRRHHPEPLPPRRQRPARALPRRAGAVQRRGVRELVQQRPGVGRRDRGWESPRSTRQR